MVAQSCFTLWNCMDCNTAYGLLCPCDSPGKNIGVGSHSLLQGIFLSQRLNPSLLHCRWILCPLSHQWDSHEYHECRHAKLLQLCPTLCNFMDCSPPGSSIHGIFQTRILECVAISFSRGFSPPRDQTQVSRIADSLTPEPPGKPYSLYMLPQRLSR